MLHEWNLVKRQIKLGCGNRNGAEITGTVNACTLAS